MHADIDRGIVLTLAGRFDEALLVAGTGLATATRYGWEARLGPGFRACMADNYLELGRYDDLERVVAPVVAGGAIHHHVIWTRQVFARALVAQGRLDDAHRQLDGIVVDRSRWSTGERDTLSIVGVAGPTAGWKTWPRASTMLRLVSRIASRSRPYRSCWRPASARVPTRPKSRGAATRPQTSPLPWTTPRDGRACSTLSSNASSRRAGWGAFVEAHRATAVAEMTMPAGSSDPGNRSQRESSNGLPWATRMGRRMPGSGLPRPCSARVAIARPRWSP